MFSLYVTSTQAEREAWNFMGRALDRIRFAAWLVPQGPAAWGAVRTLGGQADCERLTVQLYGGFQKPGLVEHPALLGTPAARGLYLRRLAVAATMAALDTRACWP